MSSPVEERSSPHIPPSGQGNAFATLPAADLESLSGSEYAPSDESDRGTTQPAASSQQKQQQQHFKPPSEYHSPLTYSHGWHSREPGERPNRFAGDARIWLRFTEEERRLAQSLEVTRSRDLSIHLYNAFALKKRLAGKAGAETQWQPPALWTAWPLEPDVVPRPGEVTSVTFAESLQEPLTSRQELEEVLIASVMAEARKRVVARQAPFVEAARVNVVEKRGAKRRKLDVIDDEDEAYSSSGAIEKERSVTPRSKIKRSSSQPTSKYSESEDEKTNPAQRQPKQAPFSTQSRTNTKQPRLSSNTRDGSLAVPTSNDEHATHILLPTIRNMQTSLDNLLKGLHRTRLTHHNVHEFERRSKQQPSRNLHRRSSHKSSESRSGSVSGSPPASSRSHRSSTRSSSGQHQPTPSAGDDDDDDGDGDDFDLDADADDADDGDGDADTTLGCDDPTRKQRDSRLGLRDWSEVLGLAAITGGFSPEVLERSRRRCEALFGEEMGMRVLEPRRSAGVGLYARGEVLDDVHLDGFPVMGRPVERGSSAGLGGSGRRGEEVDNAERGDDEARGEVGSIGMEGGRLMEDDQAERGTEVAMGEAETSRVKKKQKQKSKSKEEAQEKGKGKVKEKPKSRAKTKTSKLEQ